MMAVVRLPEPDWRGRLQVTAAGTPKPNLYNALVALRHAREFQGAVRWNQQRLETAVVKPLPWDVRTGRAWSSFDDLYLAEWLQAAGINLRPDVAQQAVEAAAAENPWHPLREWLESLSWDDRTKRCDKWLSYYLGTPPSPYVSAVGQRWLVSAVARVLRPGCKADHVLVLEGKQGKGKSSALAALAGPEWFTDELADLGSKDAAMQMRGVWIVEFAELDHVSRQEAGRIKAFITRATDRYRPPYGRRVVEVPRECVFAGTVNDAHYLRDETGNRRFWPVPTPKLDLKTLREDREQIWAEAVHLFRKGAKWWLDTADLVTAAEEQQEERLPDDSWFGRIAAFTTAMPKVTVGEILGHCLDKRIGDWKRADEMRVASCLARLGYLREREPAPPRTWFYRRPEEPDPSQPADTSQPRPNPVGTEIGED